MEEVYEKRFSVLIAEAGLEGVQDGMFEGAWIGRCAVRCVVPVAVRNEGPPGWVECVVGGDVVGNGFELVVGVQAVDGLEQLVEAGHRFKV